MRPKRGDLMGATEKDLLDIMAAEAMVERSELTRDARFADLGFQSLDVVSVLFEIEGRFGVVIEEEEIPPVTDATTLGDVLDFILGRINAAVA
jgi:acyl carrier protein